MGKVRVIVNWIEDFIYAAWISFFLPPTKKEADKNEPD